MDTGTDTGPGGEPGNRRKELGVEERGQEQEQEQEQVQEQREEQGPTGEALAAEPGAAGQGGDIDLGKVRELVLLAYPDVVQELVRGATLDELLASVQPARAAYARVAQQAAQGQGQERGHGRPPSGGPSVPAGQPPRHAAINVEGLSPQAKIVAGLRRRDSNER